MKKILNIFTIIFLCYFTFSLVRSIISTYGVSNKVLEAEKQLVEVKKKNEILKRQLETVQTDEYIEKEAREKLGMAREGDTILIMPKVTPQAQSEEVQIVSGKSLANWEKWLQLFF
jgi:cell division protein FtsL